jgi:hypothetical protein
MDYWDTASRIEQGQSLCNTSPHNGTAHMETILGKVRKAEAPNATFAGLANEDYAGFSILGQ